MALTESSSNLFHYHASMLVDRERTEAFRHALEEVVRPGDVVVDLGTGTGILAMCAARAGARKVYAIERGSVALLAQQLFTANGFADRIELINKDSYAADIGERADVLVSETLWNFGLGEGMVGFIADARERFLKPEARIVPQSVDLILAPVTAEESYRRVSIWSKCYGLDLSAIRGWAVNNWYIERFTPEHLLAPPVAIDRVDLGEAVAEGAEQKGSGSFHAKAPGTLHGFAGWFRADLSPSVDLSNAPPNQTPSWAHVFFPLEHPVDVAEGAGISVQVQSTANGSFWRWRTEVGAANGESIRFDQASFFGFPPTPNQRQRLAGDSRPVLSRKGQARLFVLRAFDGEHRIDTIEQDLRANFPDVFRQEAEAAPFVRAMVEKFA